MNLKLSWRELGVQKKLHILIQGSLIILFLISMNWVIERFETQIISHAEQRADETADGLINGMNLLMLTGAISNPLNRQLLLEKTRRSEGVRELRIVRGDSVVSQFGPGLPEERAQDDMDRTALATGKSAFRRIDEPGKPPMLRVVVPFIAQKDFRGTNCMSCHNAAEGSVNGLASVNIDLSQDMANLADIKRSLWIGHLLIQLFLSWLIWLFVRNLIERNIADPVKKLKLTMAEIQHNNDLSKRADVDERNPDIGDMARSFNSLLGTLEQANERLELFAKMFENSSEAIIITDADKRILTVNPAFELITQYRSEEVIGCDPKILSSGKQTAEYYQAMWSTIEAAGKWSGEIWNRRKNGEVYPQWLSIGAVKNHNGKVINYISLFSDITQRKEDEHRIEMLAHYDVLTKLPNRALFADRLQHALQVADRSHRKVGLMFLDLDKFKAINDTLGHLAGDQLLQSVAERLSRCVRQSDTVCRQGGDEFMILLEEIHSPLDIEGVAQKIALEMSMPHQMGEESRVVSFSIGAAIYPDHAIDSEKLSQCADQAMYQAKEAGRNNFKLYGAG
ncbi:diguanylate cyclase domain-containing protein [Gallionella capsiferriformans]|uniref:Diguanylate cyclase with PAS/PAC sensor n=1 Tax=Gallionella capsiferriformans (strain ES-2) TaxID=395494 RepID=D9SIK6_GALCS|nr:diguanylate cyclase [Gallionella capsiferriformans]ADL56169.1 diguanylate cyclase with PAS/PAC sensor [Gallionella capsiferriformans ES-2]